MEKAREARALQGRMGNPPQGDFEQMVRDRVITDLPITSLDAQHAPAIFGKKNLQQ